MVVGHGIKSNNVLMEAWLGIEVRERFLHFLVKLLNAIRDNI